MSLPLKEFYPISQVADLLSCTIDDLVHWASIGSLRLYIKVEGAIGIINNYITEDTEYFIQDIINETSFAELSNDDREDLSPQVMYQVLIEYVNKHGIDSISPVRDGYAALTYITGCYVSEDLCLAESFILNGRVEGGNDSRLELIKSKVDEEYHGELVSVTGFLGLGNEFFHNYTFNNKLIANYGASFNETIMPENNIMINLISDCDVEIKNHDLFILKKDFIRIRCAFESNEELDKIYNVMNISNLHSWAFAPGVNAKNKIIPLRKKERVSARAKDAIKILINKLHPDIKENPAKLAGVLTAEAKEQGVPCKFDKTTVSNWLKD
ncbi:hypothetical protein ACUNH5_25400 [Serratia sp. IR-2025]